MRISCAFKFLRFRVSRPSTWENGLYIHRQTESHLQLVTSGTTTASLLAHVLFLFQPRFSIFRWRFRLTHPLFDDMLAVFVNYWAIQKVQSLSWAQLRFGCRRPQRAVAQICAKPKSFARDLGFLPEGRGKGYRSEGLSRNCTVVQHLNKQ